MKILIVSQYFFPENFKINDLTEAFVKKGHQVTVLTGKPNYPKGEFYQGYKFSGIVYENYKGATVIRVPQIKRKKAGALRLVLNYLSYVLFSCTYLITHKIECDVVFCYEISPITQIYPALLQKRKYGCKVFMWVQDLWPESIVSVGKMKSKWIMHLLDKMVGSIYRQCDGLFIQSPSFKNSIISKCNCENKISLAPNWAEDLFIKQDNCEKKYIDVLPDGFIIMFAGNIGIAQDFESVLKAAENTKDYKDIHWVILGEGSFMEKAKTIVKEKNMESTVHFLGRYPISDMPQFFACADAMLVSLKDEYIFSLTIPAKTQTYMASGKPILSMANGICQDVIKESKCGLTANSGDYNTLAQNALTLYRMDIAELTQMGENGRKYYNVHFDKNTVIDNILKTMSTSIDIEKN